jgi:predicted Rossmann fold nucleotide-binding protein DprA/Smf involved in DNA uptake
LTLFNRPQPPVPRPQVSTTDAEDTLIALLESGPLHIDLLVRESGATAGQVASLLTVMELKGLVRPLGAGNYGLNMQ